MFDSQHSLFKLFKPSPSSDANCDGVFGFFSSSIVVPFSSSFGLSPPLGFFLSILLVCLGLHHILK
jgi:hypothetical protein